MAAILQLDSVSKYIGELVLFDDMSFEIQAGEKVALLGLNGAGKTSLLEIIAGRQPADKGKISLLNKTNLAYLNQEPVLPTGKSVIDALFLDNNPFLQPVRNYEKALLADKTDMIAKAVAEMDRLKLWDLENRIKQILTQLQITDFNQKIEALSGGQYKRVALAKALLTEPDFLLLDEPTNHFDLEVIEWLEQYLIRSSITLLMVTHDRYFLDRVCNRIFEIDNRRLFQYRGNYSRFVEERENRIKLEQLDVEKAQNLLRKEEDWMSRMPKARGTKAKYRIDNYFRLKKAACNRKENKELKLSAAAPRMGTKILNAKNIDFSWNGQYYIRDFSYTFGRYEKIGIIGNNGSGKSTFLEILTGRLIPENGSLETGDTIKIGYFRQEGIQFDETMKVLDAITEIAEVITMNNGENITAFQFLNYFLFPPPRQFDLISKLSGGEKRRLYLCQILMQKPNFLILDEPTNDFDIVSLQVLEEYLKHFKGCVLVVSHDRYFMDSIVDHLFIFQGSGLIKDFPGNYSAYSEWKKEQTPSNEPEPKKEKTEKNRTRIKKNKLSFKEKQEMQQLGQEIEALENEKSELENILSSGICTPEELQKKSNRIGTLIGELDDKTNRWLELSEKV